MRPIFRPLPFASAVLAAAGLLAACTTTQPYPKEYAACYERVQQHAAQLMPVFAALGYRMEPDVRLDEDMVNNRGFRAPDDVLGDAIPNGRIRLRPSRVCASESLARAVLAHEMAHVALQHRGVRGTGVTLAWEKPPQQEIEADGLALKVLRQAGGYPGAVTYVACRLGSCVKAPAVNRAAPPQPGR
ncbi:MAG: hypothetical protein OEL88_11610 [Sterolibacteriaceae bacterium MAG5]|nr:hypothetical protein [Candidatus Nitricoxidireducens bremensis]